MASRFSQSSAKVVSSHLEDFTDQEDRETGSSNQNRIRDISEAAHSSYGGSADNASTSMTTTTSRAYLPQTIVFCELRHDGIEECVPSGQLERGLVSKWRPKDRMQTGCVALVLCLNISVDPPDVIKISPCARMECWIDPFSMAAQKALGTIGRTLNQQYERWQPKARYKISLDPTVDEVKKLCTTCRKSAKSERVLFHYNGHGVPKPTANGEIWLFNRSYTQYIPLPVSDLDSWLRTPSIYVFDCSAAGMIVNAFIELQDWNASTSSGASRDCILLAACEAHETLPQSAEFPADVFTSCLTTPIKMALRWFCNQSLLRDSLDYSLIDRIPGRQTDRKTLLGELNWIFMAVTHTIAWNVLPHDLFQRLFRQDLLVASLFRNFLLAERIMRSTNCSPISFPLFPPTHQHHMWDAWDMAAEICLSQLPALVEDPNAEFQPSPFFTEQLTAFEVWLDHGSEHKKPPEQLPIVLQVLLSQCHRFRALVLLGRFLDMGPWAVDLALSVGIFPYVLKLLQTTTPELRQILVFVWTKILALDKVDLVKDGGHTYFTRFLDSIDAYPEQRAMAAFVLAVIVDGYRRGQEACIEAGLLHVCLRHLQGSASNDTQTEPLFLQWLCLCLGKLWEDFTEAQMIAIQSDAPVIFAPLLSAPQPEVRGAVVFALGTLLDIGFGTSNDGVGGDEDSDVDEKVKAEVSILKSLMSAVSDGSPLVRAEVAVALARFAFGHNKHLKSVAATYLKPQNNSVLTCLPSFSVKSSGSGYTTPTHYVPHGSIFPTLRAPLLRVGGENQSTIRDGGVSSSSPLAAPSIMHGSPLSDDSSQHSDSGLLNDTISNGILNHTRPLDNALYSQSVLVMCTLANDPSPRIAGLGRHVLSIIGIEQVVAKSVKSTSEFTAAPSTSFAGLAQSSSWFDVNGGASHLPLTFRTPPVSPPRASYMTGLRRVCSLEFRPHLMSSPDTGLADPLLGSGGPSGTSECSFLPQSTIYNWSCGYFSKPLLTAADDGEEIISRREEREKMALDLITKCQHSNFGCSKVFLPLSAVSKLHNKIASWDTRFETGTKNAILQPFLPFVIASDESERIWVWNYEEATLLNSFDNHSYPDSGISKLCLVNELDESLLLVASSDGNIRIWKDYASRDRQKLVTAFSSIQGHRVGICSVNAVVDWQQQSGCLSASQVHGSQFAAGYVDGSVRLFDIRLPDMLVATTQPHTQRVERVVGIGFQPGLQPAKIVSASQAGDIQFLDIRNVKVAYLTIDAHRGSLTALAVHRHAPLIASGSAKQLIKVFNLEGEQLGTIRYLSTFMAQKTGSVRCLAFHPYQVLLAASAADSCVSLYADELSPPR
ncbi:unnamed protein product [Cuscuta campestris]|uniref:Raptor N-terminal CASPase-like domain-containing protein n=1 Tax=Cuscuta campestris TaxID=132261 RepID=A0A484L4A8_9ASTE|nr:unnamed protein product [Cuscuta campestris]